MGIFQLQTGIIVLKMEIELNQDPDCSIMNTRSRGNKRGDYELLKVKAPKGPTLKR